MPATISVLWKQDITHFVYCSHAKDKAQVFNVSVFHIIQSAKFQYVYASTDMVQNKLCFDGQQICSKDQAFF